jgi:hypothetical protein
MVVVHKGDRETRETRVQLDKLVLKETQVKREHEEQDGLFKIPSQLEE